MATTVDCTQLRGPPPPGFCGRPALPDGYAPGQTRVPYVIATTTVFGVLATGLVALRFYVRARMLRALGLEDWTVLLALVCYWANCAVGLWGVSIGFARHNIDGRPENVENLRIVSARSLSRCWGGEP